MSGFKKRTATKGPAIPGTLISPKSLQLLTSIGTKSLDNVINGGIPIGTLVLIEDNLASKENNRVGITSTNYSKILLNHFLDEGQLHSHKLFVGSCGEKFSFVPTVSNSKSEPSDSDEHKHANDTADDTLKIAWRYKNQNAAEADKKDTKLKVAAYDSSSKESNKMPITESISSWHISDIKSSIIFESDLYHQLFKSIYETCAESRFSLDSLASSSTSSSPNLVRIGIVDIGSLSFNDGETQGIKLMKFLYALKSLARNRLCVIALTQTTNIESCMDAIGLQERVRGMVDFVFQTNPLNQENSQYDTKPSKTHHGMLTILKTPSIKCLKSPCMRNHGQYLFKSTKSKFVLERLHLPPELNYAADNPKQAIEF